MIAKVFQKFSFTSAGISSLLLLVVTYYYLTLEIKWSFVESKISNGVLIYGALMLTNYAIDTVTRQLTIERSNRHAYHLLLYPLVIICYPIESVDLKFILSSTAVWAAWRNMRMFLELTNNTKRIKRLFDAMVLLSLSTLIILDNLIIFFYPLLVLLTTNIKRDLKYFIILFMTPLIILPTAYVLLSFLSLDGYLFSSYFFADQSQVIEEQNFNLTYSYVPIFIVFVLYVISVIIKFIRTYSFTRRILDIVGVLFIVLTSLFLSMNYQFSGSEFHYLSLPLVYMISQIFVKKIKSLYVIFIFVLLLASIVTFKFLI